jgi:hypothetical protein
MVVVLLDKCDIDYSYYYYDESAVVVVKVSRKQKT